MPCRSARATGKWLWHQRSGYRRGRRPSGSRFVLLRSAHKTGDHCRGSFLRSRAAAQPYKKPTCAVGLPLSVGFMFCLISTGREMSLFLVFFWCSAVFRFGKFNSRFGEFASRFVRINSRLELLREFAGKGLIRLAFFAAKRRLSEENRRNSRYSGANGTKTRSYGVAGTP